MNDSEQCSNRLISLLVNFACELGKILTRYDSYGRVIIDYEPCSNRLQLYLISRLVNFSCELGQIMTRYDFRMDQTSDSDVRMDSKLT